MASFVVIVCFCFEDRMCCGQS